MYNRVVVPLDGSKLAEIVLPHLEEIAKGCNIPEVLLVSVTEPMSGKLAGGQAEEYVSSSEFRMSVGTVHTGVIYSENSVNLLDVPVTLGRMAKTALRYLNGVAKQLEEKGLHTRINVLVGSPADQIASFAAEQKADLIIMATHGRGGIKRLAFGSVAEKVVRAATAPVMLVKPGRGFKETKRRRKGKAT